MTDKKEDAASVMAFDALYTTNQMQKLKVLLPYIEPSMQKHLAVYIKYMELQYTMNYTKRHPTTLSGCGLSQPEKPDLRKLCKELSLYSSPEEIKQLEQIQNMLQTFETVQEMTQTMNAMKEIFPDLSLGEFAGPFSSSSDNDAGKGGNAASPIMDILMNMLTPEQQEMYQAFSQSSFGDANKNNP